MTRWLALTTVAALLTYLGLRMAIAAPPEPPAKPPEPNLLKLPTQKEAMEMKLKGTQRLLEAITMSDFKKIQDTAAVLIVVSNQSDFLGAYKGKEYAFHIELFRRPVETIAKKARDKNIDGVMIAYNELTLSCLKCHQAMRDRKFDISLPRELE